MPSIQFPVALKGYNSLRACLRHLGTSMEKETFFKPSIFFSTKVQSFKKFSLFFCIFLLINNSIKLKYKAHLLLHQQHKKSYIFSSVFVINLNWKKVLFFFNFRNRVSTTHVQTTYGRPSGSRLEGVLIDSTASPCGDQWLDCMFEQFRSFRKLY